MDRRENVTAKDLELLNFALDNALSPTEQVEFDRRLTESPHLNTLLQEQKQLKAVLAQLPVRKVPHNFTLTRAEARQAKQRGIFQPLFGWASVISTLVLALVFGSELMFKNLGASAPAMTESAQTYLLEEEAPVAMQAEDAQPKIASSDEVYLLNWGAGGIGGAGGMGGGGSDEVPSSFTIDIFVPEMVSAAEMPAEEGYMMNETPPDDMITEVFPETVPEDIPEDLLPTEAEPLELTQPEEQVTITSEDLPSEPPVLGTEKVAVATGVVGVVTGSVGVGSVGVGSVGVGSVGVGSVGVGSVGVGSVGVGSVGVGSVGVGSVGVGSVGVGSVGVGSVGVGSVGVSVGVSVGEQGTFSEKTQIVGVAVGVSVGVKVGVKGGVSVGVTGVFVGVNVGVKGGVSVGITGVLVGVKVGVNGGVSVGVTGVFVGVKVGVKVTVGSVGVGEGCC